MTTLATTKQSLSCSRRVCCKKQVQFVNRVSMIQEATERRTSSVGFIRGRRRRRIPRQETSRIMAGDNTFSRVGRIFLLFTRKRNSIQLAVLHDCDNGGKNGAKQIIQGKGSWLQQHEKTALQEELQLLIREEEATNHAANGRSTYHSAAR